MTSSKPISDRPSRSPVPDGPAAAPLAAATSAPRSPPPAEAGPSRRRRDRPAGATPSSECRRCRRRERPLVRQGFPRREDGHRTAENGRSVQAARSSASRPVAVTTSKEPCCASALATNSRALAGPTRLNSGGHSRAGLDELLEGRRRERQFNEPRDWGFWASRPVRS